MAGIAERPRGCSRGERRLPAASLRRQSVEEQLQSEEEEDNVVREDDAGLDPGFPGILPMAVSMTREEVEVGDDDPDGICQRLAKPGFLELLLGVVRMISEETEEHDDPAVIDRARPIPAVPVLVLALVAVAVVVVRTRMTFLRF